MRYISVQAFSQKACFAVLSIFLLTALPARASVDFDEDVRNEVVGLFGTILAPSIFTPASSEQLGVLLYGRTLTSEGEVPDFDADIEDEIDEMTIYAGARLGGLGLTLGFGQGSEFEFSQPVILAVDYKTNPGKSAMLDVAIDVQYSMIALPEEENIKVSALGFGVVSVNGIVSSNLLGLLEPYGSLGINYVYLNSDAEGFIDVWKPVPKVGLQINILPVVGVATELVFIMNEHLDSAWMWNIGANARF